MIDELGIRGITIGVPPAGCAVLAYNYFDVDMLEAPHGRGCAVATGIKRTLPDRIVFSYQGDGDLAAIGTAETIHAANRGENITVIFINNAVYGMTGGQMAPTTMLGQKTTTSPAGRNAILDGHPIRISEILATWTERPTSSGARSTPRRHPQDKESDPKGLPVPDRRPGFPDRDPLPLSDQLEDDAVESCRWIDEVMTKTFPLGVIKDAGKGQEGCMIKTIFAGFGGQGVLMMGYTLAQAAMSEGYHVTFLPAYGAEVRGGTANCTVAVSDEEIASPVASSPDYRSS